MALNIDDFRHVTHRGHRNSMLTQGVDCLVARKLPGPAVDHVVDLLFASAALDVGAAVWVSFQILPADGYRPCSLPLKSD
jgi:hypothetical protein